ncbi:unnamed protein product [Prunus brigantina]
MASDMSETSSMDSNQSPKSVKYCHCGSLIKSRTSWTDMNPGRRFEACDNNQVNNFRLLGLCTKLVLCSDFIVMKNLIITKQKNRVGEHYFRWLDKETCTRGKNVVPGLLRRIRMMETEMRETEERKNVVVNTLQSLEARNLEMEGIIEENKKELDYAVRDNRRLRILLEDNMMRHPQRECRMSMGACVLFMAIVMMMIMVSNMSGKCMGVRAVKPILELM